MWQPRRMGQLVGKEIRYGLIHISGRYNLSHISYCTKLKSISTPSTNPYLQGDIPVVKTLPLLENLNFNGCTDVYGDISDLGSCSNLKKINVRGTTKITGTVESVITSLIIGGRTSAIKETGIEWVSLNAQELVTFNGTKPSTNGYFIWSATETEGQYEITYKASSNDSTISSVVVTIN